MNDDGINILLENLLRCYNNLGVKITKKLETMAIIFYSFAVVYLSFFVLFCFFTKSAPMLSLHILESHYIK